MSKKPVDGSGSGRKRSSRGRKKSSQASRPDDSAKLDPIDPDEHIGDGESTGVSQAPSEVTDDTSTEPPRPVLPAFGFADEVLRTRRQTTPSASGSETESEELASPADLASPSSADRIYDFADSLAHRGFEDDQAAPRRISTWVTFDLADEIFAIPVDDVREVLRVATVTRVPHAPHPIRGVTNLRGRVIPVIDLRRRIELTPIEIRRSSRILVVSPRGRVIGLLVDAVRQVVHLDLDQVQAPPEDVMTVQSDYLTGVYQQDDDLLLLLDVERTLVIKESGAA